MKFDLKNSKLLFEVRYQSKRSDEIYTYEWLYRTNDGKYFMHFDGGKYSEYAVKIGYYDFVARSGNFFMEKININAWKESALSCKKKWPEEYMVIDWEKEEDEAITDEIKLNEEYMMTIGDLAESRLPF